MAATPGILTDWPWKPLGSYKYVILTPWVVHSIYSYFTKEKEELDYVNLLIVPFMLWRMLHDQLWISYSRHRNAKGNNLIVDKSLDFDQIDRESNWDDQILLMGVLYYTFNLTYPGASHLPLWRWDGIFITILLHMGPVEFLYYWFHRALHHHYLYSRYHSHHHSSIVTEPITSVIHPFAEDAAYFVLFAIPLLTTVHTGTASLASIFGYVTYIDFMNNMGHCNFEYVPKWVFSILPPLKYLMYTPTYHSLHHTQFRTNYSLFMPIYDYMYGTMDKSTDSLYETSLEKPEESPDIVHLTHLTTFESIYHLRLGFASLAANPQKPVWYLWVMWPFTLVWSLIFTWFDHGHIFISDRHTLKKLKLQSWVVPRYNFQYSLIKQRQGINSLIEEAILEADSRGVKVLSLGLLNQGEELNRNGELFIERNPKLKTKVVDGSSLAAAVVLNSIPKGATQVLLTGKLSKVAYALASALCQRGIQVATLHAEDYEKLKMNNKSETNLVLTPSCDQKIWLVGDGTSEKQQLKALKATLFISFSQFPAKRVRKDCFYLTTPAMLTPPSLQNMYSCEDWLPRKVMSAWRIAGIVHALEEWNVHECGDTMFDIDKVWQASLHHGFRPFTFISSA